jgi:adenylate cyclase
MSKSRDIPVKENAGQASALPIARIRRQLKRILASPEFLATDRRREFLEFVVNETLDGKADEIKGYTIATRLFGRGQDFDQATDPIVSIQAAKLRRELERYYLVAGKTDPMRIDIPKGTYVPSFRETEAPQPDGSIKNEVAEQESLQDPWPTLLVHNFSNMTGEKEMEHLAAGLAAELAHEITRHQEIRVLLPLGAMEENKLSERGAAFVLNGNIQGDAEEIKISVSLIDAGTGMQIWSDTYSSGLEAARMIAFQEQVATVIAAKIAGEHGAISKTMLAGSRDVPPAELKGYEAILRYYEFERTQAPESFRRALTALEHALKIEPENGLINAMLARLYGIIYSLEHPGFETALEKAFKLARRAVILSPASQRTHDTLAFIQMIGGDIEQALQEVERTLALNPNSLLFLDSIAYLMTLLGEWERGTALTRKVMHLNPYYIQTVHHTLWLDWFRQGEYENAYRETLNFKRPTLFWEPLMKASTLGQLGRVDEGKQHVEKLLELKPDFCKRARILIGHFIKFEDIAERIVDGLRKAGLEIE